SEPNRRAAQQYFARTYDTRVGEAPTATGIAPGSAQNERFMRYSLRFPAHPEWGIEGYKRIREEAGLGAWRDTSSLHIRLYKPRPTLNGAAAIQGAGIVHLDLFDFLYRQLPSVTISGTNDPARITWATARFATFFFGSLQRISMPGVGSLMDTLFRVHANNVRPNPPEPGT